MALAVVSTVAEAGSPASSSRGRVDFTWDAPVGGCPAEAHVLAELERLLGGSVAEQGGRRLSAIARTRLETDGRWNLRLTIITEEGTFHRKEMLGEDCEVLADAAALLAAMAIDPRVLDRQAAGPGALEQAGQARELDDASGELDVSQEPRAAGDAPDVPDQEPEPEPESEPEAERETPHSSSRPATRRRSPSWITTRMQAGMSTGDLPGAAAALQLGPVLRLGSALQWKHVRLEIEGHYTFLRRMRFEDESEVGADFRQGFVAVRGCGVLHQHQARLEFPICAGLEGGATVGRGVGFVRTDEGRQLWLAADANVGLVWAFHPRVGVGVSVEGWVALLRRPFTAGDIELWRPRPAGVRLLMGIEARFQAPRWLGSTNRRARGHSR
jgi:hypothetical protein